MLASLSGLIGTPAFADGGYLIGAHYNPPGFPVVVTDYAYNVDEGWSNIPGYAPNGGSTGYMDWVYVSLRTTAGYGVSLGGSKEYRYSAPGVDSWPERQPLLNGSGKWFEFFDPTQPQPAVSADENTQIDLMKSAGIDFISYNATWDDHSDNAFGGYPVEMAPLDYFILANKGRATNNRVLFALQYGADPGDGSDPASTFAKWSADADGSWNWHHTAPVQGDGGDYAALFESRMYTYLTNYINQQDSSGNPLYLFHHGMPVMFMFDSGTIAAQAKSQGTSLAYLIYLGNIMAQGWGYPGIYWVDTASTIVDGSATILPNPSVAQYAAYQDFIAGCGFNAATAYNYQGATYLGNYSYNYLFGRYRNGDSHFWGYNEEIDMYSNIWSADLTSARNNTGFKYFLPVTPGWDSRPVGEYAAGSPHDMSRSCDDNGYSSQAYCSPDGGLFSTMLANAKATMDANPDVTDQVLMIGSWNELTEGSYVIPTVGDNGTHAQAIRNTFKPQGVWSFLANEGDSIIVGEGTVVRYGDPASNRFLPQVTLTGSNTTLTISNSFFGGDPAPYVVKQVQVLGTWVPVGKEGAYIYVGANSTLRFGANGHYVIAATSVPFNATNATFGRDPAPGVLKSVDVLQQ